MANLSIRSFTCVASLVACMGSAAASNPQLIGEFGEWRAFKSKSGKAAHCFAVTMPSARLPIGLKRDPAYLFVTHRPAESIEGEISIEFGYPLKVAADSSLKVGSSAFPLMERGSAAWLQDDAEQPDAVAAFRREWVAVVETTSKRGNKTRDEYPLKGFTKALKAISNACD